jgi:hypothetical protein
MRMRGLGTDSLDFVLTDPPYIVRYRGRDGRNRQKRRQRPNGLLPRSPIFRKRALQLA